MAETAESGARLRVGLVVLYTEHLKELRRFYTDLGLSFEEEQHGGGPVHYAATLPDGTVLELYPATTKRPASSVRLGLHISGQSVTPPLEPGQHVLTDPEGRAVEVYVD
jgi:catechol-2,3-dioxygenase